MALSAIRFVRRLNLFHYHHISTSILSQQNKIPSQKVYKTEDKLIYFEDPDNFGSLAEFSHISDTLEDEGDIKEEKLLQNAPLQTQKLTISQYADLIKQYIKYKRIKEAIDVLEVKMLIEDRVKPENYIYNILIGACADVGYTKKAFKLFNDMKRRALKPTGDTYTSLFHACANSPWPLDGLKNAQYLRDHMIDKGIEPNLTNYNSMIKAFGRCGDLSSAFKIVDEMVSKEIKIRVHTFNHLLHACISDKNTGLKHALMVWRKMLVMREKPNIYSFNLILKCVKECNLGTKENLEELIYFLKESIVIRNTEPKKLLNKPEFSELPEEADENRFLNDCNSHTNVPKELTVVESKNVNIVSSNNLNHVSISLVNRTTFKNEVRNIPNLLSKFIQMQEVFGFKEIKTVQEKFAVVGGLDDFFKEMEEYAVKPDIKTFTQIVSLLDDTRETEMKLLEKIKTYDIKPDVDFYNMLIKKRCLRSDYDGAFEVKQMIEKESKRRKRKYPFKKKLKLQPNIMTYGVLAMACDTKERAQQLLAEMEEEQIKVNIEIIGTLLKQGTARAKFGYIYYIMDVLKQNNLKVNDIFIKHLESFRERCADVVQQGLNEKYPERNEKYPEGYMKACINFLDFYKNWIKEINIEELQMEHPWKQFREIYPETVQRLNVHIKKPKRFYKRNRKHIHYKPQIL